MKIALATIAAILGLSHAGAAEIRVAAAASLDESITEICDLYGKAHGTVARPVLAGSNILARQISEGAPIDVFLSADTRTMDGLVAEKHVRESAPLLTNSLVVVVPAGSGTKIASAKDLLGLRRIAIGDPAGVPAGVYARKWLEGVGLWEKLAPRCVGAENVRGALAVVEAGNADAAIVYQTDAAVSDKVRIALKVPAGEMPGIVYPVAVCTRSADPAEARRFVRFLGGEEASAVFRKRGFGLAKGEK